MKIFYALVLIMSLVSCDKISETVSESMDTAKEKVQQKASEAVQQTIHDQINKLVNAESIAFNEVFQGIQNLQLDNLVGKKMTFPNGTPLYIFRYKTTDKTMLLDALVAQPTTDESKSKKTFEKIDGSDIVEKLAFLEKFVPANTIDLSFLDEMKKNPHIEYYKIVRFPNSSTVIMNPKSGMVYHFVELKKES
ncbi:MAG: hypothetical protein J0I53_11010 [Chryseobacterium sp.]|nr:hypothetical protein [Chryseobacterium sp.]